MRLFYNWAITIMLMSLSFSTFSQAHLSVNLEQKLSKANGEWVYINLHLAEKVDLIELQKSFRASKTPVNERAKTTLNLLQKNSNILGCKCYFDACKTRINLSITSK